MELLPPEIRARLPLLYSQETVDDPIVHCKFFTPWSNWTWYALEFDQEDIFFGLVVGHETELGYFSLSELQQVRHPIFCLGIERDLYFDPMTLSEVRRRLP